MDTQSTLWCAGLPLVARLPLAEGERRALRREAALLLFAGILCAPLSVLLFLVGLAIFAMVVTDAGHEATPVMWISFCVALVLVGMLFAVARESFRRAKGLRGDLRAGEKLRFEGTLAEATLDLTLVRLLRKRLMRNDAQPQWLEVLPVSQRVWRANDRPVRGWFVVSWARTAEQPEVARIAAGWLEPVGTIEDVDLHQGQRELSAEEKDELRRYAKDLWRKPLLPALIFSLWCFPLAAYALWTSRWPADLGGVMLAILTAVTILSDYGVFLRLRQARRIGRDLAWGFVIIVRARADDEKGAEGAAPGEEHLYESLPHSGLLWTEDGRAAGWRKV
jgi:hypothetical protein